MVGCGTRAPVRGTVDFADGECRATGEAGGIDLFAGCRAAGDCGLALRGDCPAVWDPRGLGKIPLVGALSLPT